MAAAGQTCKDSTGNSVSRRGGLWTVDRGARSLCRHVRRDDSEIAIVGNALANRQNRLHVLGITAESKEIRPMATYDVPCEVWCVHVIGESESGDIDMVAAMRLKGRSSVKVLRLGEMSTAGGAAATTAGRVTVASSVDVDGSVLKVVRNEVETGLLATVSDGAVSVMSVEGGLRTVQGVWSGSMTSQRAGGDHGGVWDGGWIDGNTVFVASGRAVSTVDRRSGKIETSMTTTHGGRDGDEWHVGRFAPRVSAACCDSAGSGVYVGGQDGSVYAFDRRRPDGWTWVEANAHRHWTSAVAAAARGPRDDGGGGVVSGGTDGVVRRWAADGKCVGTFPQHEDTVTTVQCCVESFMSASYDGRVALSVF